MFKVGACRHSVSQKWNQMQVQMQMCVHILSVQLTLSYKQSYLCNQMQSDTITLHNSNWIMFIRAVRKLLIQLYCHFVAVVLDIYWIVTKKCVVGGKI